MVVVHKITPTSPFYNMTATDMREEDFEIVVSIEGTQESTGQSKIQARSSYLNTEIFWGFRFEQIVVYNSEKNCYETDYSKFNSIYPVKDF